MLLTISGRHIQLAKPRLKENKERDFERSSSFLLLDNYNAWTNIKVFNHDIASNGQWIEIKQSFIATQENYRFVFGIKKDTTDITFYLKDMFLVEGDYTSKKLPDSLFK